MHHAIAIEENNEQNLYILPNLMSFFGLVAKFIVYHAIAIEENSDQNLHISPN